MLITIVETYMSQLKANLILNTMNKYSQLKSG